MLKNQFTNYKSIYFLVILFILNDCNYSFENKMLSDQKKNYYLKSKKLSNESSKKNVFNCYKRKSINISILGFFIVFFNITILYYLSNNNKVYQLDSLHLRSFQSNLEVLENTWQDLLECTLVRNNNFIDLNKSIKYCNKLKNKKEYFKLLDNTLQYTNDLNYVASNQSYHNIISLRRKIIIASDSIYPEIKNHNVYKNIIINLLEYDKYHNKLIKINKNKIFHMHLSKCAGNSVISTFKKKIIKPINEKYNIDCKTLYNKYPKFIYSREAPLFPVNDLNKPILCDEFIYLVPIREPIERICSSTQQINFYGLSFLKEFDNKSYNNECESYYEIDGNKYFKINKSDDFKNIYSNLLNTEENNDLKFNFSNYNHLIADREKLSIKSDKVFFYDDVCNNKNKLNVNGNYRYFKFGKFVGEFHLFEMKYSGYWDISWLRTIMGSNIYTSWLGYDDLILDNSDFLLSGVYVPRSKIKPKHFLNAFNLLLKADYVLPMKLYNDIVSSSNMSNKKDFNGNSMWDLSLSNLDSHLAFLLKRDPLNLKKWKKANRSKKKITSKGLCKIMADGDKKILLSYNKFDIMLFHLSQLIEKADLQFFFNSSANSIN